MATAYYANYTQGHHGSLDRIGGVPTHLPESMPSCECSRPMTFLAQIYFDGKHLGFVSDATLAIQLYSCFDCFENRIAEVPRNAKPNIDRAGEQLSQIEYSESNLGVEYSRVQWNEFTHWRDINWTEETDPDPAIEIEQFWNGDEIRTEHEHLLNDKIGGCFPTVDHGGTSSFEQGIVAQLTLNNTVYITLRDDAWGFFQY